jgi:hypothetical protein
MKAYRHIAITLLICFSVFLGHDLVPHHHHSEVFHSPLTTNCPFEHGDQPKHNHDADTDHHADTDAEANPFHCHAFNDVVFEKYRVPVNKRGTGQVQSIVVSSLILTPEVPLVGTSSSFTLFKLPCRSIKGTGTRGLRGPPAQA